MSILLFVFNIFSINVAYLARVSLIFSFFVGVLIHSFNYMCQFVGVGCDFLHYVTLHILVMTVKKSIRNFISPFSVFESLYILVGLILEPFQAIVHFLK